MIARLLLLLVIASAAGAQVGQFDVERPWIGPHYWANRLQDWRASGGRAECLTDAPRLPMRTLHLLTRDVDPTRGGDRILDMSVDIHLPTDLPPEARAGFLFGAGDDAIDYRLTAMVHHRPAADGGLLALVDPAGRVVLCDNSVPSGQQNQWSIAGPLDLADVPELDASRRDDHAGEALGALTLRLLVERAGDGFTATLESRRQDTFVSRAVYTDLSQAQVDGGVALVAHRAAASFDDWMVEGDAVVEHERRFGPIVLTQYTLHNRTLKLTAQATPLGAADSPIAALQMLTPSGGWRQIAEARLDPDALTFRFTVEDWDATRDVRIRVVCNLAGARGRLDPHVYEAAVRREPLDASELTIAALTCHKIYTGSLQWNHDGLWFPHADLLERVQQHNPDLIAFLGDQIYEGDLTPLDTSPIDKAILDYHYKWFRFCWAFADLTRDRPTITIPDDHDVFHGNIWGAGGKAAEGPNGTARQDSGGYKMPARFVNMVHRTQTSHLPTPGPAIDVTPIGVGISVYTTRLTYAGLDVAILADRQWKSAPKPLLPEAEIVNGWAQNADFDPRDADHPDAHLLGAMQENLLDIWAKHWPEQAEFKIVMSQTPWSNVATLPAGAASGGVIPRLPILEPGDYPPDHHPAADFDSGAWPQSARNRAVRAMRQGSMLHITGDQHLASVIQYGVEAFRDAGYAFTVPAIANTWPRRWQPAERGANQAPGAARYTGDYLDGFGNKMTVLAAANPVVSGREPANLHDRMPGYGIIRIERPTRRITLECWPRWADPTDPAQQYPGWPIEFIDDRR